MYPARFESQPQEQAAQDDMYAPLTIARKKVDLLMKQGMEVVGTLMHHPGTKESAIVSDCGKVEWQRKPEQAVAAPNWLPMDSCPNDVAILISRDNGSVELVTADDNDYNWQPYDGKERYVDKPNGWMYAPDPVTKPPEQDG